MSVIRLTKEALIEQLTSRLPTAKKIDAAAMKQHKRDEAVALVTYKKQLRLCLKLSYQQAKEGQYTSARKGGSRVELDAPGCPILFENQLVKQIELVSMSQQTKYVINQHGTNTKLWGLLQIGLTESKKAC